MIKEFCMGLGAFTAVMTSILLIIGVIKLVIVLLPYSIFVLLAVLIPVAACMFVIALWMLGKTILGD